MTQPRTRHRFGRLVAAVFSCAALVATTPALGMAAPPPIVTPVTDHCPHRVGPPSPVDESEVVAPGSTTPAPLPVPAPPVGGTELGACGVIADPSSGAVPQRLTSAGWLVADMDSGAIIAAKDPHGRYRPASTIKVLLSLAVLDALDDHRLALDDVIAPTAQDWSQEGDSCGMGPGGHYTIRDLLTGLIMVSGNDCAHALARRLGGVEETLTTMNAIAHSLHALDTRASSPSGLDAAGMSTSPYDLALIFRAASSHPTFREMMGMTSYRFPGYPKRADVPDDTDHPSYLMQTSDHLLLQGYPGMMGGKTGYTDDAQKTFVGAAHQHGRTILIVQMYGLSTADDNYWTQAQSLLDYGFRSDPEASVGQLVAAARTASSPSTTQHEQANTRAASHSDEPSSWSSRLLIGLVAALAAVILARVGLRLFRRSP